MNVRPVLDATSLLPEPFLQWFAGRGWAPRAHQLELLAKARDPETVQIDFEWARNFERPDGGFNFCESCLILAKPGAVGAVSEFAFKISQSSVQLIDAMNVEPPVKAGCKADDGNERGDNRNDKEYDSAEERGQPERRVALPEAWAGAVKCLCRWRKRQIIRLLGGKFSEPVKGAGCPVHLAHGFQQQILQGGVKIFSHEQAVAGGKQVNVRSRRRRAAIRCGEEAMKLRICRLFAIAALVFCCFAGAQALAQNAYITNLDANTVSVIDTTSNTVAATIPVGFGSGPVGVAVSPD